MMWTIKEEQIQQIEANSGEPAVLPCEQQETTNLSTSTPSTPFVPKILNYLWLSVSGFGNTEESRVIKSTSTNRKVKIQLTTQGITDNTEITLNVINKDETVITTLYVTITDNSGLSKEFDITEEMLNYQLLVNVDNYSCEGDNLLSVCNVIVEELQIQLIDCRSNEKIPKSRIKKIVINNEKEFSKEFDLSSDKTKITTTGIQGLADALVKLGYGEKEKDSNTKKEIPVTAMNKTWTDNYNNYWKDRINDFDDLPLGQEPPTVMINYVIGEYNNHLQTDENGVLKVQIPFKDIDSTNKECSVQVEFFDFPIVCEGTGNQQLERFNKNASIEDGTGFSVEWTGTQNTGWLEGFGWKLVRGDAESELKVSEEVRMYYNNSKGFSTSTQYDWATFQTEESENNTSLFTLFALQWCQPVWDEIEDRGSETMTQAEQRMYIQTEELRNKNMHIVTRYTGGTHNGKEYGTYRHRYNDSHVLEAIDLYTINQESFLFAIHGGIVTNNPNSPSAGNNAIVSWNMATENRRLRYLHMHSFNKVTNTNIKSGEIIGLAGRTGNLTNSWPCHVHLDDGYGTHSTGILSHRDSVDLQNRKIIPCYSLPLLFPCLGGRVLTINENPENCHCSNSFANHCWALLELRCPFLLMNNSRHRKVQSQLRSLNYYNSNLDGNWGVLPTSHKIISNTRSAIYRFKRTNNLLAINEEGQFNPTDYDLTEADEEVLNDLAPINVNNL